MYVLCCNYDIMTCKLIECNKSLVQVASYIATYFRVQLLILDVFLMNTSSYELMQYVRLPASGTPEPILY